jgi:hypothetical protein
MAPPARHFAWLLASALLALQGCSHGYSQGGDAGSDSLLHFGDGYIGDGYIGEGKIGDGPHLTDGPGTNPGPDTVPPITTINCNNDCKDFVVSRLMLPDATTAATIGVDYDNDGKVDNVLGAILGSLSSLAGSLELQSSIDESVYSGDALLLMRVQAASFTSATKAVAEVWRGASQTCCSEPKNLTLCQSEASNGCFNGSHTFSPHATDPYTALFGGTINGGQMMVGPSDMTLTLNLSDVGNMVLHLKAVYVKGSLKADRIDQGAIAGAISKTELDNTVIPALAQTLTAEVNDPNTSPSTRDTILTLFDANGDKTIDASELSNNGLIKMLLAGDVDVDNDGAPELSLGLGFEAVSATIQP